VADSFEKRVVAKRITLDPENLQPLADWIFNVATELEKTALQGFDLKGRVVDGEVFIDDLPVVGTGTSGSLWNDSGTLKIVP